MLAMVFSSVRYAPPMLGSETRLKKAPKEVNIRVDVKLVASPHAPRARNHALWSSKLSAPSGNTPTCTFELGIRAGWSRLGRVMSEHASMYVCWSGPDGSLMQAGTARAEQGCYMQHSSSHLYSTHEMSQPPATHTSQQEPKDILLLAATQGQLLQGQR